MQAHLPRKKLEQAWMTRFEKKIGNAMRAHSQTIIKQSESCNISVFDTYCFQELVLYYLIDVLYLKGWDIVGFNHSLGKITKVWNSSTIIKNGTISRQNNNEKATWALQRLKREEANLMEKRQNLFSLLEKQQSNLQKEVESKNKVIEKLRAEITELKIECEKLSISVRASRHPQNLRRTSKKNFSKTMKNKGYSEKAIEEIWKWYDCTAINTEGIQ